MSARASELGAINLGQGFPDEPGPPEVIAAAKMAVAEGKNQYAPGRGVPELRLAIAEHAQHFYGQSVDPDSEVLVTAGATEAIAATVLALCRPGDEVVVFEPLYDSYAATIELSGARLRPVRLHGADWSFDEDDLRGAVSDKTRLVLLNTPHNPTGRVFSHSELALLAELCIDHDVIAVTDEVYEHLVFSGPETSSRHERLACFPGMHERTVTISSAGKTFSVTGWKIGWLIAPPGLTASITAVKQFLTFTNGTPLQYGVATGLGLGDDVLRETARLLEERRDLFCGGLSNLGWDVRVPAATYFCSVDVTGLGAGDARSFASELLERAGVAAIPMSSFYVSAGGENLVRFAFCKKKEVLKEALDRLARW
jgi:N-succinyldiaminopimelate aminotransferase